MINILAPIKRICILQWTFSWDRTEPELRFECICLSKFLCWNPDHQDDSIKTGIIRRCLDNRDEASSEDRCPDVRDLLAFKLQEATCKGNKKSSINLLPSLLGPWSWTSKFREITFYQGCMMSTSHHSGRVFYGSWSGLESLLCMESSTSGGKQPCEPFSRTSQEGLSSVSSSWQCLQGADPPLTMESEMRSFPALFGFQDGVPLVLLVCVFLSFFRTSLHIFLPDPAFPQHSARIPFFAFTRISLDVNS